MHQGLYYPWDCCLKRQSQTFRLGLCFSVVLWLAFLQAHAGENLPEKNLRPRATQELKVSQELKLLKTQNPFKKDSPYYSKKLKPELRMIFSEEFRSLAPLLSSHIQASDNKLSQVFKTSPYFRTNSVFFTSPWVQISNAFAQVRPLPFIRMHAFSDSRLGDQYSLFNWSEDVILHEISHIYQFSQNSKWDRFLWPVLNGLVYRNQFLPTWVIEGHSTLIESLYGSGGRLWSGYVRAFVFAQIQEDKISLKKLFRTKNDNFWSEEIYLHGAYFWSYLYSLYGGQSFDLFSNSSTRFPYFPIDYWGTNKAFKKTFGKSLKELFQEYKEHYGEKAKKQKALAQKALFKSKALVPINSDRESLYFLISDLKSPAWLILFDKKSQQFKKTKSALILGKLFKKEGEFVSRAAVKTGVISLQQSLADKKLKALSEYNSQYVMELKEGQVLSLNAQNSHKGNALLLNGAFYDRTHSSAVMDDKLSVYYFKQSKNSRILYKDKKPLISFESYFAYPVEADQEGLYFIGATAYGSSLFVYSNKDSKIYRLSDSDRIVFARKIKGEEFLVSEISPPHYEYKILKSKKTLEKPFVYQYSFKKENVFSKENKALNPKIKFKEEIKKYHPSRNWQLSQLAIQAFFPFFGSHFQFKDPLSFNSFNLFGDLEIQPRLEKKSYSLSGVYSYNKYRPSFNISVSYESRFLETVQDKDLLDRFKELGLLEEELLLEKKDLQTFWLETQDRNLSFLLDYPLFRDSRNSLSLKLYSQLGQRRFFSHNKKYPEKSYFIECPRRKEKEACLSSYRDRVYPWRFYTEVGGTLSYLFARRHSLSYSYYKKRFLEVDYSFLSTGKGKTHGIWDSKGEWERALGGEFFIRLWGRALWGRLDREPFVMNSKEAFASSLNKRARDLYQGDLSLLKAFDYDYSSLRFPFSIKRWAGITGVSWLSYKKPPEKSLEKLSGRSFQNLIVPYGALEADIVMLDKIFFFIGVQVGLEMDPLIPKPFKGPLSPHWAFWIRL